MIHLTPVRERTRDGSTTYAYGDGKPLETDEQKRWRAAAEESGTAFKAALYAAFPQWYGPRRG